MSNTSVVICILSVDFLEIHKKTKFSVGSYLSKKATCVLEKGLYCDDPIFVHESQLNN